MHGSVVQSTELNELEVNEREMKPRPTQRGVEIQNSNTDQNVKSGTGLLPLIKVYYTQMKYFSNYHPRHCSKELGRNARARYEKPDDLATKF